MKPQIAFLCAAAVLAALPALAQDGALLSDPTRIPVTGGEQVYNAICRGCHMPEGKGAVGAGMYPALADNPNIEYPEYPIYVIINGQKAMPPLGGILDDQQIADVVSYIQTHFGNDYGGRVTAEQVAASRP